jgi:hypothetical protein
MVKGLLFDRIYLQSGNGAVIGKLPGSIPVSPDPATAPASRGDTTSPGTEQALQFGFRKGSKKPALGHRENL